jgi:hypothetical protein
MIPAFLAGLTLLHLAACANLRKLTITGKGKTIRKTLPINLPPNSFPVLDTVCIEESKTAAHLSKVVFQRLSQLYKETAPLNKGGSRNEPSLIDEVGQGWRRWRELMCTP